MSRYKASKSDIELEGLESRLFGTKSPDKKDIEYSITLCKQGEEAVEAVKVAVDNKQPYAVCFMDVRMPPGMNGVNAAQEIRKLDRFINIVIVTAYSDINPLEISAMVPPSDKLLYMQKPFHPWELWQVASSLTAKWEAEIALREINRNLEKKVFERTFELEKTNLLLEEDLAKRILAEQRILDYQKQLKMLASELVLSEEKEKRRLAESLHNSVGHALSAVQIKLALLMDQIKEKELLDQFECLIKMTEETADAVRAMMFEISPPVLYELGFESAVEWFLERISQRFDKKTSSSVGHTRAFKDTNLESFAFRTVQELVINSVKHGCASCISVDKQVNANAITIVVSDDGKGFDANRLWKSGSALDGFGLFSIREHANYFGGTIDIESSEGKGTTATLTLPMKNN